MHLLSNGSTIEGAQSPEAWSVMRPSLWLRRSSQMKRQALMAVDHCVAVWRSQAWLCSLCFQWCATSLKVANGHPRGAHLRQGFSFDGMLSPDGNTLGKAFVR